MPDLDAVFELVRTLSLLPAPPGREEAVDRFLAERLAGRDLAADGAGNLVLTIPGRGEAPLTAITAHKDEIGASVKRVDDDGRLRLRPVGDTHPWVWGETPLVLLGDHETIPGVLSFGSRHVSKESKQHVKLDDEPVRWRDAWVETKRTREELADAGVRPGTRVHLGAGRREPVRLGADGGWVACPALDDKASVAVLILLAERLGTPAGDVDLVFSAREEVGCHGALYYARHRDVERLVAMEVAPAAEEYGLRATRDPVIVEGDAQSVLDDALGRELAAAAAAEGVELQHAFLERYGSDASTLYASGLVGRAGSLAVAADNTHGCEIAHLDALERSVRVLAAWLDRA